MKRERNTIHIGEREREKACGRKEEAESTFTYTLIGERGKGKEGLKGGVKEMG